MNRYPATATFCLLFALLVLPFTASAQAAGCEAGPVADDAPVITIGTTASQSGRYAREGNEMLNGYYLWLDWVNGEAGGINVGGVCHRADLIVYDDRSGELHVETYINQLINLDGVDFLLGPYSSNLTMIASDIADAYDVLMVAGNAADDVLFERGYQRFFGIMTPASQYTRSGIELAHALGARTAVIINEVSAFPMSVANGARATLEELDMELLASHTYFPDDDFTDVFEEFAALEPDLFIGGGYFDDSLRVVQTAREVDFAPPAMLLTVGPALPSLIEELGADADYVWSASQWERSLGFEGDAFGSAEDFAERYEAAYGVTPSYLAASAAAAARVLQLGIEAASSTNPAAVTIALRALRTEIFYGPVDFDETGQNIAKPMVTTQIQDGEIVVIAPAEVAVAEAVYPAPAWSERVSR